MTGRIRRLWRSAITGRFVTALFARRHPDTTVEERRADRAPQRVDRPDPFVKSLDRPPIDDPDAR